MEETGAEEDGGPEEAGREASSREDAGWEGSGASDEAGAEDVISWEAAEETAGEASAFARYAFTAGALENPMAREKEHKNVPADAMQTISIRLTLGLCLSFLVPHAMRKTIATIKETGYKKHKVK